MPDAADLTPLSRALFRFGSLTVRGVALRLARDTVGPAVGW